MPGEWNTLPAQQDSREGAPGCHETDPGMPGRKAEKVPRRGQPKSVICLTVV